MIAVIYTRYSDSKQTYQSIEGQLKVCNKFAEDNGFTVLRTYTDEAKTGKSDKKRNCFKDMIKDSKKKSFDTVIVYAFDRFGRNVLQSLLNEKSLQENDVTLLSATENNDNTPSGRMQRNILLAFAQYYSEELAQKTARGMGINADNRYSNGGPIPLGYKLELIDPNNEKSKKKYVKDEEAAEIVVDIYTKYANGDSIKSICDYLNVKQLKSSKGSAFNKNSLHSLLKNKKYLGYYVYNGIEHKDGMPQIIDEELFNKVADRMKINKALPARSRAIAEYLLTGKLYCGYCKTMMIGHSSNQVSKKGIIYNYYKCKNQKRNNPDSCKKKMIHKDSIENKVIDECRKILTPQNINRIAKEIMKIAASYNDNTEIIKIEKCIKKEHENKENQMASLRACKYNEVKEMIFEDLNRISKELEKLEKQLEIEMARRESITEVQTIKSLTRMADGDINDVAYRRSLIRLLVNKIFAYDDRLTITFNTGDDEITITDVLLSDIEQGLENSLCASNNKGHQWLSKVNPDNHRDCRGFAYVPLKGVLCSLLPEFCRM